MTADQPDNHQHQHSQHGNQQDDQLPYGVVPGDIIFQSPAVVADPAGYLEAAAVHPLHMEAFQQAFGTMPGELATPGLTGADALLVLEAQEGTGTGSGTDLVCVRLGLMSSEAAANHLPELAEKLTKPKVIFIGGDNEPVVLAIALLDADRLELGAPANRPASTATRFGSRGQFTLISTAEEAPNVDEQVAEVVGHVDPSMLRGLRLFHSYVRLDVDDMRGWLDAGIARLGAATAEDVFTDRPAETWRQAMKRSPFPENLFATWASHPERN